MPEYSNRQKKNYLGRLKAKRKVHIENLKRKLEKIIKKLQELKNKII